LRYILRRKEIFAMTYPPRPSNKHPSVEVARQASTTALAPFRFQPGRSGNPSGMSKSQRESYLEARKLAHQAGPGAIRRLAELAGLPLEGEEWVPLDRHGVDERVVYMAATALAERAYGKPREFDPEQEVRAAGRIDFSRLSPEEIEAVAAAAQLLARARVQPQESTASQVIEVEAETGSAE
jgi:hypothetical protein